MAAIASQIAKERATALGLGNIEHPVKYRGQDYEKLKAECLASGTLFEDPEFPAASSSLGIKELGPDSKDVKGLEWKRPKEICDQPAFIVGGATRDDIRQGSLANCWLLTSIASLTMHEGCKNQVIPGGQEFNKDYAGIFHFLVWRYGYWMDVVVDDRLPTKGGKLTFVRSDANEFWSALLEKAYAKLCGCYEALMYGNCVESMTDFTAGVSDSFGIIDQGKNLLPKIQKAINEISFISCTGNPLTDKTKKSEVIRNHAYSVTGLEEVVYGDGTVQLIRVRNPWGHKEGKGAWSDNAPEWDKVDAQVRARLLHKQDDGEFWMAYSDFQKEFSHVEICDLSLSKVCCGENYQWYIRQFDGSWIEGSTSGGNLDSDIFWTNPKFRIKLQDPDDDQTADKKCTICVALMQKGIRRKRPLGFNFTNIGCHVFKINNDEEVGKKFFKENKPIVSNSRFWRLREATDVFKLSPGDYMIVVATKKVEKEVDFCLRIFTRKPTQVKEIGKVAKENPLQLDEKSIKECELEFKALEENAEYDENEVKKFLDGWLSTNYKDIDCKEFSPELVGKMIKLVDLDNTKTLSTQELKTLWIKLKRYITIFLLTDADKTGTIDAQELRNALKKTGFTVDDKILEMIVQRYINKTNMSLSFIAFIACIIKIETLFNTFEILETEGSGEVTMTLAEWMRFGMA